MDDPKPSRDKREFDKEVVAHYERLYRERLEELREIAKVLAAFGRSPNGTAQVRLKPSAAPPVFTDLKPFLRKRGKPCHQSEIITVIGNLRHQKYPALLRPWGDVWKSLEYQARNNAEIVPVEWHGNRLVQVELKPKPRAPRIIGGTEDAPELYQKPDNLFWFKAEISSMRRKK